MRPTTFMLGSSLLFFVSIGSAAASPCTNEIDNVTQVLTAQNADARLSPPLKAHPSAATMSRETTGSAPPPDTQPDSQGSAGVSGQEPHGQAQDATEIPASAALDAKEDIFSSHVLAGAMSALERARLLDRQGKESECLSAVGMAKLMSGQR